MHKIDTVGPRLIRNVIITQKLMISINDQIKLLVTKTMMPRYLKSKIMEIYLADLSNSTVVQCSLISRPP